MSVQYFGLETTAEAVVEHDCKPGCELHPVIVDKKELR